jgi:hypothetical protein
MVTSWRAVGFTIFFILVAALVVVTATHGGS